MLKRTKRRYLAVNIDSETSIEPNQFTDAIWTAIAKLYGEHGASQTGLTVIEYKAQLKTSVLRANNAAVNMVRAALASITRIAEKPATVHVVVTSGTLKALRNKNKTDAV